MRLNFEFNDAQMESLNTLKHKTGVASMKELFNNAMTMLEWAVDETAQGKEIEATDGKTSRVFVTPLLRQVKMSRPKVPVASDPVAMREVAISDQERDGRVARVLDVAGSENPTAVR